MVPSGTVSLATESRFLALVVKRKFVSSLSKTAWYRQRVSSVDPALETYWQAAFEWKYRYLRTPEQDGPSDFAPRWICELSLEELECTLASYDRDNFFTPLSVPGLPTRIKFWLEKL
jgi:hypothetical protein